MKSIQLDELIDAYNDCKKHKGNTAQALEFGLTWEKNLKILKEEINSMNYQIGKSTCFIVTQPKLREVFAADFRDRIIHHLIMRKLEPLFERVFISSTYNCRKGKGTLYGAEDLFNKMKIITKDYTREAWIGKFDMKGFFMSIHKPTLWNKLEAFILQNYKGEDIKILLDLVKKVTLNCPEKNCIRKSPDSMWNRLSPEKSLFTCKPDCGLPIGNLTSQCFANFYLNNFDHMMYKLFKGFYGRYVDDFFVIAKTKKEITERMEMIKSYLWNNLKIELHPDKVYIQRADKGVKFIGYCIKRNRFYTGERTYGKLVSTIKKYNKIDNITEEVARNFVNSVNSYLGYLKHTNSFRLRKKALKKIDPKWNLWIYIDGRNYYKLILRKERTKRQGRIEWLRRGRFPYK